MLSPAARTASRLPEGSPVAVQLDSPRVASPLDCLPGGAINRLFDIIAEIKEADAYTQAIGTDLGAIGSGKTPPDLATLARWKYRAIYRVNDTQVGLWSAEVSVTVG